MTSDRLSRRSFLSATASATAASAVAAAGLGARPALAATSESAMPAASGPTSGPLFVSTWNFGKEVNEAALAAIGSGGDILDAIEQGIHVAEADPNNHSVGLGGTPKARGVVQLDACIMDGRNHNAGSVAAIHDIAHPITVARMVMERTKHVMLVGEGARDFAVSQGIEPVDMLTDERRAKWEEWKKTQEEMSLEESHDTISLLGLTADGALAGGCSTSGWGYALHGRVGDSPILGSGLYVDGDVGAAGGTGLGENVMRHCATYAIVDAMSRGAHPRDACVDVIERIGRKDPQDVTKMSLNFCAVDKQGRHGAAGTDRGFRYAVTTPEMSEILEPVLITG